MRREIAEGMMVPGKLRSEYQKNEMRQGVPSVDYQLVGEQSAKKESSPSPIRTKFIEGIYNAFERCHLWYCKSV